MDSEKEEPGDASPKDDASSDVSEVHFQMESLDVVPSLGQTISAESSELMHLTSAERLALRKKGRTRDAETYIAPEDGHLVGMDKDPEKELTTARERIRELTKERYLLVQKMKENMLEWQSKEEVLTRKIDQIYGEDGLEDLRSKLKTALKTIQDLTLKESEARSQVASLKVRLLYGEKAGPEGQAEGEEGDKGKGRHRRTEELKNFYIERIETYKTQLLDLTNAYRKMKEDFEEKKLQLAESTRRLEKLMWDNEAKNDELNQEKEKRYRSERDFVNERYQNEILQTQLADARNDISQRSKELESAETRYKTLHREHETLTALVRTVQLKMKEQNKVLKRLSMKSIALSEQNSLMIREITVKDKDMRQLKDSFRRVAGWYRDVNKKLNLSEEQKRLLATQFFTQTALFKSFKREFKKMNKFCDDYRRKLRTVQRANESMRVLMTKDKMNRQSLLQNLEESELNKKGLKFEIVGLQAVIFKLQRYLEEERNSSNDAWRVNANLIKNLEKLRLQLEVSLRKEGILAEKIQETELRRNQVLMKLSRIRNERNMLDLAARKAADLLHFNKEKTGYVITKLSELKEDKAEQDMELLRINRRLAKTQKMLKALQKDYKQEAEAHAEVRQKLIQTNQIIKRYSEEIKKARALISVLRLRIDRLQKARKNYAAFFANRLQESILLIEKNQVTVELLKRLQESYMHKGEDLSMVLRELRRLYVRENKYKTKDVLIRNLQFSINNYERQILSLKTRVSSYEREMGHAFNYHRLNILGVTDPGRYEQICKYNYLHNRYINLVKKIMTLTGQLRKANERISMFETKMQTVAHTETMRNRNMETERKLRYQIELGKRRKTENMVLRTRLRLISHQWEELSTAMGETRLRKLTTDSLAGIIRRGVLTSNVTFVGEENIRKGILRNMSLAELTREKNQQKSVSFGPEQRLQMIKGSSEDSIPDNNKSSDLDVKSLFDLNETEAMDSENVTGLVSDRKQVRIREVTSSPTVMTKH